MAAVYAIARAAIAALARLARSLRKHSSGQPHRTPQGAVMIVAFAIAIVAVPIFLAVSNAALAAR